MEINPEARLLAGFQYPPRLSHVEDALLAKDVDVLATFQLAGRPQPRNLGDLVPDHVLRGLVGSHSIRKLASSWVRGNGISLDDKDYRGRWKRKRVSNVYDNIQLNFVDAKVASVLCPRGVANYVVVNKAVANEWTLDSSHK